MENLLLQRHFSSKISFGNLFSLTCKEHSIKMNMRVIYAIIEFQRDFFVTAEYKDIKAMTIGDISLLLGKDKATISRILKDKYLTVNGVLFTVDKFLYSGSVKDCTGKQLSKYHMIDLIQNIIANEDTNKPFGDLIIAKIIEMRGIEISRELVTKYRNKYLVLPPSTKRKSAY